ncbi:putative membrane protein [Lipingzhangella halophila]|uniref:Putative membrane protein n=1 Tax=Lipingzhangella halophila TaxID=1783352 RepID=A0A7W7RC43_9ACTN|nr:PH domain-containing protein [Lipingzhangella halophila]MBB4929256.1 putative membrane protein [Lipingzhangella halophila]
MSEANEDPATGGPPDSAVPGSGGGNGVEGETPARKSDAWFDTGPRPEEPSPRDDEPEGHAGEHEDRGADEWFAGPVSGEDLPPLREVTAPTDSHVAEEVTAPGAEFGFDDAHAGPHHGHEPARYNGAAGSGERSEPAPRGHGDRDGAVGHPPVGSENGHASSGEGGGPESERPGRSGAVTPLWPHIDEDTEAAETARRAGQNGHSDGQNRTGHVAAHPATLAPPAAMPWQAHYPPGAGPPPPAGYAPQAVPGPPAHHPPGYYPVAPGQPPPPGAPPGGPGAPPPHAAPYPGRSWSPGQPPPTGPGQPYVAHPPPPPGAQPPGAQPYPGAPPPGHPYPGAAPPGYPPGPGGPPPGPHPPGSHVRFLPPSPAATGPPPPPPPMAPPPPPRPAPGVDITRGRHRVHWSTVPFQVLLFTVVFLALPGLILMQLGVVWFGSATLAAIAGATGYSVLSWLRSSFELNDDHLIVHMGLVRQVSREIPLSRLQAVDVVRPLLMQILGLAELRVELAGGDSSEMRLRYLTRGTAERLRASLLAHAAGLSGKTPEAPEWPFYRLPFGLLLGALAFRLPVLGAFLLFLVLMITGFAFMELGVLGGAVPLLLGLMRGFAGPLLRYTDFYSSLSPDGLRLRFGIFQARMQTVPPGRVQAVRIVEPLLWRLLGVARVEANVAGYVGERQMDSSTLLPVVPRRLAFALVNELFPGTDASRVALHGAARARSRNEALGVDGDLVVTSHGLLCRVIEVVPEARVQTVRLTAGPLSRRRGVGTVHVDTPPGPIRAHAADRDIEEARRLVDGIVERGHAARMSSTGPERWATRSEQTAPSG